MDQASKCEKKHETISVLENINVKLFYNLTLEKPSCFPNSETIKTMMSLFKNKQTRFHGLKKRTGTKSKNNTKRNNNICNFYDKLRGNSPNI